jgi:uncharacterized protein
MRHRARTVVMSLCCVVLPNWIGAIEAQEHSPRMPPVPAVVTVGQGVVRAVPDRAFVRMTVETRARTPQDAQRQNAQAMTAVQQKMRDEGVAEEAVRTVGFDLRLEVDWADGRRVVRGYVARSSIEVRTDDLSQLGRLMDQAVAAGATEIGDVRFDLKDREAAEQEALQRAVRQARARADAAAAAAGTTIARIVRIEEGAPAVGPPMPMQMRLGAAEAAAGDETPIAPGEIVVRANVTVTSELR